MRKALIDENGRVNIIEAGDTFDPGPGKTLLDVDGAIQGGTWDGVKFLPPDPRKPSRAQAAAIAMRAAPNNTAQLAILVAFLEEQ